MLYIFTAFSPRHRYGNYRTLRGEALQSLLRLGGHRQIYMELVLSCVEGDLDMGFRQLVVKVSCACLGLKSAARLTAILLRQAMGNAPHVREFALALKGMGIREKLWHIVKYALHVHVRDVNVNAQDNLIQVAMLPFALRKP